MSWDDQTVERLKELWAEGHSASAVAEKLGIPTRNAVLGKLHRLGLSARSTVLKKKAPPRGPNKRKYSTPIGKIRSPLLAIPKTPIKAPPTIVESSDLVAFFDLEPHHCRWPVGDNPGPYKPYYCGKHRVYGLPYCEHHARLGKQPVQPRKPSLFVDRRLHRAFA